VFGPLNTFLSEWIRMILPMACMKDEALKNRREDIPCAAGDGGAKPDIWRDTALAKS